MDKQQDRLKNTRFRYMDFRTTFPITPSPQKITYSDPVMFIGSCFAASVGKKFEDGHMPVMINPSGTVYNPVSVCNTIETIITGREYTQNDLNNFNGLWLSFNHYTNFSSDDPGKVLLAINSRLKDAHSFLNRAKFLFITFGTARVFRWNKTGKIVSNCHKIPASEFTHELLPVKQIVELWNNQLNILGSAYPELKVVFTISPVRHLKDGAHGNQVSKSVLFLAVEELLLHPSKPVYFPAYELVMDDLRDYRFYDTDLLHPSSEAVDYIWDAFTECWFNKATSDLWKRLDKITKAYSHIITSDRKNEIKIFASRMISEIDSIMSENKYINLESERNYFLDLEKTCN